MSLNALIINTLTPLAPVAFQTYTGTATTYITFFEYNQNSALNADDLEAETSHYIQVDVWSKGDYTTLVSQIKASLIEKGFRRLMETEYYETDTKIYHKVVRFHFSQ